MKELDDEGKECIHGIIGDEDESNNKVKKCPNCGLEHPFQHKNKCPSYEGVFLHCQQKKNLGNLRVSHQKNFFLTHMQCSAVLTA